MSEIIALASFIYTAESNGLISPVADLRTWLITKLSLHVKLIDGIDVTNTVMRDDGVALPLLFDANLGRINLILGLVELLLQVLPLDPQHCILCFQFLDFHI